MVRRIVVSVLLLGLAGSLTGCGKPTTLDGVKVQGKIVKGGQPLQVPRRDIGLGMVELELVPAVGEPVGVEPALVKEDGSFSLVGGGRGIRPGKYKLAVYQRDKGPGSDLLGGKFSRENTPVIIDVPDKPGTTHDLKVIDLDQVGPAPKPQASAQK